MRHSRSWVPPLEVSGPLLVACLLDCLLDAASGGEQQQDALVTLQASLIALSPLTRAMLANTRCTHTLPQPRRFAARCGVRVLQPEPGIPCGGVGPGSGAQRQNPGAGGGELEQRPVWCG